MSYGQPCRRMTPCVGGPASADPNVQETRVDLVDGPSEVRDGDAGCGLPALTSAEPPWRVRHTAIKAALRLPWTSSAPLASIAALIGVGECSHRISGGMRRPRSDAHDQLISGSPSLPREWIIPGSAQPEVEPWTSTPRSGWEDRRGAG